MQMRGRMTLRSTIDPSFSSVLVELGRVRHEVDFPAWCRQVRDVEAALARFCDAMDSPRPDDPPLDQLAREAFMAVLALAQLLAGAYSDDTRTKTTLELTQLAVSELLDSLEPYVSCADRETRRVLLDGDPLDIALERMFS